MFIRNIIFDLGGVIIDIDFNRTFEAFRQLGAVNIESVYAQGSQDKLLDDFETGKITAATFRSEIKKKFKFEASDEEFDQAWNALLFNLPLERLNFVKKMRETHKVFLFSNTNEIHLKHIFNECEKQNGCNPFDDCFDKQYSKIEPEFIVK